MKKVSIIVPVYNMAKYLNTSISDLLNQTYQNIEVILIDDGSTDDSLQVCKEVASRDERVRVLHTKNQGSGPARNLGLEQATGDYVYFMDADDHIERKAFAVLTAAMAREQCDLMIFGFRLINSKGKVTEVVKYSQMSVTGHELREKYQQYGIGAALWNKLFDLRKIKEHMIRFPDLRRHQDAVFCARYVTVTEKAGFTEQVFYTYRLNDLKKEWEKYPEDYIDNVINTRLEIRKAYAVWDPPNRDLLDRSSRIHLYNIIKAMELSFNKKMNYNKERRLNWLQKVMEREEVQKACAVSDAGSKYQNLVCSLVRAKKLGSLYHVLHLKVLVSMIRSR